MQRGKGRSKKARRPTFGVSVRPTASATVQRRPHPDGSVWNYAETKTRVGLPSGRYWPRLGPVSPLARLPPALRFHSGMARTAKARIVARAEIHRASAPRRYL